MQKSRLSGLISISKDERDEEEKESLFPSSSFGGKSSSNDLAGDPSSPSTLLQTTHRNYAHTFMMPRSSSNTSEQGVQKRTEPSHHQLPLSPKPRNPASNNQFVLIVFSLASVVLFVLAYTMAYAETFSSHRLRHNPQEQLHFPTPEITRQSVTPSHNYSNITIVLFGDSLLNEPYTQYNLEKKIKSLLPRCFQNMTVLNKGLGGNKISDLKERVSNDVLLLKPDMVFIHFDSDISDQDIDILSLNSTQLKYKEDYDYVLHMMTSSKIPHIAIAGPGLLGEGAVISKPRFRGKDEFLDMYRSFNQQLAQRYHLPYIDIRKAYQAALPLYWILNFGYVTVDGEHPNDRGSEILAQYFAAQINQWYPC